MGGREGDARQRRRFSSAAEGRDTEHVDAVLGLLFLGLLHLPTQRLSLADSQICMLCVCISYLKKKMKKRKKVAEPSVTFKVIEICLPFL